MVFLTELAKGERGRVTKVYADGELRHRFNTFGIHKGREIYVDELSLGHSNLKIIVGNSLIALRANEAKMIEIEKYA